MQGRGPVRVDVDSPDAQQLQRDCQRVGVRDRALRDCEGDVAQGQSRLSTRLTSVPCVNELSPMGNLDH